MSRGERYVYREAEETCAEFAENRPDECRAAYEAYLANIRRRRKAGSLVARAYQTGQITRQQCVMPGCTREGIAHHPDYTKPLAIVWLCRLHHARVHGWYRELGIRL